MGELLEFYENSSQYKDKVNMEVIKFIDEVSCFPDRDGHVSENIDHLFCAGYCYYFANMLKLAFGGRVIWVHDRGHIAWADCPEDASFEELQKAVVYDITGIYDDYERVWPIEYLGDLVVDYMHNGKEFHLNDRFHDWCDFCNVSECFAITFIWETMSTCEIVNAYKRGLNCVETAYEEWNRNVHDYQIALCNVSKGKWSKASVLPLHTGIKNLLEMYEEPLLKSAPEELHLF